KYELLPRSGRELFVHRDSTVRIAVIDRIPGFVSPHRLIADQVNRVPVHEMADAKEDDPSRSVGAGGMSANRNDTEPLKAEHGDQNEEACERGDVMRIEVRIEIAAQRKYHGDQKYPAPPAPKKERNGDVQRRQKEKAVVAGALGKPPDVTAQVILTLAMHCGL